MRKIKKKEYEFLKALFDRFNICCEEIGFLSPFFVEELKDGGMGSLRFHFTPNIDPSRRLGSSIIEGEFFDIDGILVSFTVNVDKAGKLFELDLWRTDFNPLQKFPEPKDTIKVRKSKA